MSTSLAECREWPKATVMKLFEMVKPHALLWNHGDPQWSNSVEKGRVWKRLAEDLDPLLSSKKCRDRFHSNKKKYANELRKQIERGDQDTNKELMWLLEQPEEEKENHGKAAGTSSDPPSKERDSPSKENDAESGIHSHESDEEVAASPDASANQTVPVSSTLMNILNQSLGADFNEGDVEPQAKRCKRKASTPQKFESTVIQSESSQEVVSAAAPVYDNNNDNFLINLMTSLQNVQVQQQEQAEQECNIFGRQVEIDLRRLNTINRARARLAITGILSELYQRQQRHG